MSKTLFKAEVNNKHTLAVGYEREFVKCEKCNAMAYYDYTPYSLSNPIITTPCGHSFKDHFKKF